MKKIHILAILLIVASITVLLSATDDVSTYASFSTAENEKRVKITGELAKNRKMEYRPDVDPDSFKFFLKDNEGAVKQVILAQAKPVDFERAESIVLTGAMKDEVFYADEILMKCPSKYKNEELSLKEGAKM